MGKLELPYNPASDDPTRSHHGGNQESDGAFQAGNKENWVELTYLAILTAGLRGNTPEEVAEYWSQMLGREVTVLTIRPRFTTLLKDGRIKRTNQRRESLLGGNSRVCVATVYGPLEWRDTRVEQDPEPDHIRLFKLWGGETLLDDDQTSAPEVGAEVPRVF